MIFCGLSVMYKENFDRIFPTFLFRKGIIDIIIVEYNLNGKIWDKRKYLGPHIINLVVTSKHKK